MSLKVKAYVMPSLRIQSLLSINEKKNLGTPSLLTFKPKKAETYL